MYSNTNYDTKENDRPSRIRELQDYYKNLRRIVLGQNIVTVAEEVPNEQQDAFMKAGKRALSAILPPELPGEETIRKNL